MGVLSLLLWIASALAIGTFIVWRAIPRREAVRNGVFVASAATLLSLLLLLSMLYANPNDDSGVVVASTVDVVSGPGKQYEVEFKLHSGAQVRLVDSRQGWVRIALPGDDLQGWAPSDTVEALRRGG